MVRNVDSGMRLAGLEPSPGPSGSGPGPEVDVGVHVPLPGLRPLLEEAALGAHQ